MAVDVQVYGDGVGERAALSWWQLDNRLSILRYLENLLEFTGQPWLEPEEEQLFFMMVDHDLCPIGGASLENQPTLHNAFKFLSPHVNVSSLGRHRDELTLFIGSD